MDLGRLMCQYRLILGMKHSILLSDIGNGGGYTCMGIGAYNKTYFPLNFV